MPFCWGLNSRPAGEDKIPAHHVRKRNPAVLRGQNVRMTWRPSPHYASVAKWKGSRLITDDFGGSIPPTGTHNREEK